MPRLEWENLKNNQCPKCGYELDVVENEFRTCQNPACDFCVTKWKYRKLMDNFDARDRRREMEDFGME